MILNQPKIGIVGIGFVGGAIRDKIAEDYNVQLNVLDTAVKKNTLLRLTEPK